MNDRREIKFRVFDPCIPKDFGEAETGNHSGVIVNWEYIQESTYLKDAIACKLPVMQFTGFYDKTRREIYEDDIIKGPPLNSLYVVEFHNNTLWAGIGIKVVDSLGNKLFLHAFDFKDSEVIGNIHENPEILDTAKQDAERNP